MLPTSMAHSERNTENLIRDRMRELGYEADDDINVDEQKPQAATLAKLLKKASKSGKGGKGAPEFIVTETSVPDLVMIVECKADPKKHKSKQGDKPVEYAVDGVLHYAKFLAQDFHVVAVAASGETEKELVVSTFLHAKGEAEPAELKSPTGATLDEIVPWSDCVRAAQYDPAVEAARTDDLMAFSVELHKFMREFAKLTESEKPLLVSGTLIALQNQVFAKSYMNYTSPAELQKAWLSVIEDEIGKADIPNAKKQSMSQPYSSIAVHPNLGKKTPEHPQGVLFELIDMLAKRVLPLISVHQAHDVVGAFYGEFLKYTGGDKKALGIVLTPRHITELFADLANVTTKDVVVDPCAGTGAFLISAMNAMMKTAKTEDERADIRQNRLIGIEDLPNMYALAASNMILRGDGKANLYQGSCFEASIVSEVKKREPTVGMINPPYSQEGEGLDELSFVLNMLDLLKLGGTGIAIVPMSCATSPSPQKGQLLKHHTLKAVMSMPNELFSPVAAITCIMVFEAHKPHVESKIKTWFGYWKDDGFVKTKHRGRIDRDGLWPAIRASWLDAYRDKEVHPEFSVLRAINEDDEWCAEAYLETDYSKITPQVMDSILKEYAVNALLAETGDLEEPLDEQ